LDAQTAREDSVDNPDTTSLVLDSVCYTKVKGVAQGENQKNNYGKRFAASYAGQGIGTSLLSPVATGTCKSPAPRKNGFKTFR
jgi:hypothetical protein